VCRHGGWPLVSESCPELGFCQGGGRLINMGASYKYKMHIVQSLTEVALFLFFELCCARHYNCGSHWAVLVLSLLGNGIKRKGQGQ